MFLYKQRTFALTYLVCVLGLVANCFAETNLFYDLGFKETIMTLVFLMPPIVKAKFLTHKDKVEETKNLKVYHQFDAFKVGEITAMIFLLAIAATSAAFMSTYGMNNTKIYLIIIGGCFGGLLIVPYLLALWLKSDDPMKRLLHVSLNLIALFGIVYTTFVLGKDSSPMHSNYILSAVAAFVFILFDVVLYALIRKDLFLSYLKITFFKPIMAMFPSLLFGGFLTFVFIMITLPLGTFGPLETFGVIIFYIIAFFLGAFFIPHRPMKKYLDYVNDATLYSWKSFMLRGDK